ncbi:MAG: hypothetical protein KDB22_06950, partial [Planctomycetales bacterium]|nr:hypothetical protein [Planctomycetales bacterium]
MLLALSVLAAAQTGCRGRAYNDVYLENMAAEMRDLEDQLYEFDYEYQLLEQENNALAAELARLRTDPQSQTPGMLPNSSLRRTIPESERAFNPNPLDDTGNDSGEGERRSILEGRRTPEQSSLEQGTQRERTEAVPPRLPPNPMRAAPNIEVPESLPPGGGTSEGTTSEGTLPNPNNAGFHDLPLESLIPPMIEFDEPTMTLSDHGGVPSVPENSLELNLSRIAVPTQLTSSASAPEDLPQPEPAVTDLRVVEMVIHPTLSRALNLDDRNDDDGVYVVLIPKNERGQMVPVAAELSVVVLDPARDPKEARLGRWDYSEEQVRELLQPMGNRQGIHLTLRFSGPKPLADQVIVFARYKFTD